MRRATATGGIGRRRVRAYVARPGARRRGSVGERGSARILAVISVGLAASLLLSVLMVQSLLGGMASMFPGIGSGGGCRGEGQAPSDAAKGGIPANYLELYKKAGKAYGVPWTVLAGIGRVETDHGRLDASGVTSGTNFAGAAGPMQFLLSTWQSYGVDGDHDGREDVYDPADAIPAAAKYLRAAGAPVDLHAAIFAYNHAGWYVDMVLDWAGRYARGGAVAVAANLSGDCLTQAIGGVPEGTVGRIIAFARAQLGKPYVWGTEGPSTFDCSGLTSAAYAVVGVHTPRVAKNQFAWGPRVPEGQERPGDLVFFGNPVHHVGIVIGDGQMIEAPHTGALVRISSYEGRADLRGFTRPLDHDGVVGSQET